MENIEDLFRAAKEIPFSDLEGRRVFTIGTRFFQLDSRRFRSLLRAAGAEIEKTANMSTEMIVVGENPSRSSIIRILLTLSEESRPPFVKEGPFLLRFHQALQDLCVERGKTFRQHLTEILELTNYGQETA